MRFLEYISITHRAQLGSEAHLQNTLWGCHSAGYPPPGSLYKLCRAPCGSQVGSMWVHMGPAGCQHREEHGSKMATRTYGGNQDIWGHMSWFGPICPGSVNKVLIAANHWSKGFRVGGFGVQTQPSVMPSGLILASLQSIKDPLIAHL